MRFSVFLLATLMSGAGFARPEWIGLDLAERGFQFPDRTRISWSVAEERFEFAAESGVPSAGLLARVAKLRAKTRADIDDSYSFGFPKPFAVNALGATTVPVEGLRTTSEVTNGLWRFSLSVPLAAVGGLPKDGILRIGRNFARADAQLGGRASVAVRLAKSGEPELKVLRLGGGNSRSEYPVAFEIANPTTKAMSLKFVFKGNPEDSQPCAIIRDFSLAAGERRTFEAKGAILDDEPVKCLISLSDVNGRKFVDYRGVIRPNFEGKVWTETGAAENRVSFRMAYFPSYSRMRVRIDATTLEERPDCAKLHLKNVAGKTLHTEVARLDASGVYDGIFSVPDLRPETVKSGSSDYVLELELGQARMRQPFVRSAMEWEGNKYGLSGVVPPPFKPVKSEKGKGKNEEVVSVVLREHTVDKTTGLWNQVKAAGKDILARPMAFVSAGATPTPHTYTCSTEWDVDGLMDWRLTLKPGHYEPFSLEIPVKAEIAKFYHASADTFRTNPAGTIPAGTGRVWASSNVKRDFIIGAYLPYVWIGGALRGISVCGDNDRGWILRSDGVSPSQKGNDGEDAVATHEIVREADGTAVLRLNLVQRAVDLKEERTIRIGFQATPVKPMEKNWRADPLGFFYGAELNWGGLSGVAPFDGTDGFFRKIAEGRRTGKVDKAYLEDCMRRFPFLGAEGSPMRKDDENRVLVHLRAGLENAARNAKTDPRMPFVFYTNARGIEYGIESGRTYCDEWSRVQWKNRNFTRREKRDYELDPVGSFRDYAAWWYRKMLETGACEYIYWDDAYPKADWNLVGTDAYRLPDGRIQPSVGVFSMRALIRRGAVVQAELGMKTTGNWVHITNAAVAPFCSFAGVNYDWEDIKGDKPLQESYPLDYMQALTCGRQMGVRVAVMGYFSIKDRNDPKLRWLEHTGTGACLVHEVQWTRVPEWRLRNDQLTAWGYRDPDTKVWNYWDEDVPFPVDVRGCENGALAMSRNGKALVVVSDYGGTDASVAVRPDAKALGIRSSFTATDFLTGAAVPVKDGTVRFGLAKYDYIILELK